MSGGASPQRVELGWLSSPVGTAFAGLYRAPRHLAAPRRALLACHTFGGERMVLHGATRRLGELCAARGVPLLWLDYPGVGDADGYPRESPQFERFLASLHSACDFLRAETGVDAITTFGFSLGGALAFRLACERDDVDSCALHAPVLSGRRWLREQAAIESLGGHVQPERRCSTQAEGDLEFAGYLVHAASVPAIRALDLNDVSPGAPSRVLVLRRSETSGEKPWVEGLRARSIQVSFDENPPLHIERDMLSPGSPVPEVVVQRVASWVCRLPAPASRARPVSKVHATSLQPTCVVRSFDGTAVREEVRRYGPDAGLCAIVTSPVQAAHARQAPVVILVNGGHNHRPGINRNHTEWARRWAARGLRVLRMDYRGLGDADALPAKGAIAPLQPATRGLYVYDAYRDVQRTVRFALDKWGHPSAVVIGLCAGGFEALRAARVEPGISGVVALNLLRITPQPPLRVLATALRSRAQWDTYADQPAHLWRDVRDTAVQVVARSREQLGLYRRGSNRLLVNIEEIIQRGTFVRLVFNESEPLRSRFDQLLMPRRKALDTSGRFRIDVVDGGNHIMSPLYSQERLGRVLDSILEPYQQARRDQDELSL